jgi:hypothetical protein
MRRAQSRIAEQRERLRRGKRRSESLPAFFCNNDDLACRGIIASRHASDGITRRMLLSKNR